MPEARYSRELIAVVLAHQRAWISAPEAAMLWARVLHLLAWHLCCVEARHTLEPRQDRHMYKYKWDTFAPLPGLLVATLLAVGCRDSLGPEHGPEVPVFSHGSTHPAVAGLGALGNGLAIPTMNRQEFDFDATDPPGGRLFVRDFRAVRGDGSVGSLTANPAVDAATGISSFTQTSATCVTFGGIGRHDSGELMEFSADACDNGSPGTGVDSFGISVPVINYSVSGTLTEGEITLSGGTKGDLEVRTATTGSDLDPDGYAVTVDSTTSQAIGVNATVRFNGLAEGSHTIELSGVAGNCTLSGSNPRTVTVVAGSVASTTFDVSCTATAGVTRVTGLGAIGSSIALPHMERLEFDFDATSNLTGRVVVTDYSVVRGDGVSVGRITVDAATDPATGITSFSRPSATCVTFGGIGRLDTGELYQFFIDACDNASPGVGADTFTITLPDRPYSQGGTLSEGDIAISTF